MIDSFITHIDLQPSESPWKTLRQLRRHEGLCQNEYQKYIWKRKPQVSIIPGALIMIILLIFINTIGGAPVIDGNQQYLL